MRTILKRRLCGLMATPVAAIGVVAMGVVAMGVMGSTPAAADEFHITFGSGGFSFGLHIDDYDYIDHGADYRPLRSRRIIHHDHAVRHSHRVRGRWFRHSHAIPHEHRRGRQLRHTDRTIAHSHGPRFWNRVGIRRGLWWDERQFERRRLMRLRNGRLERRIDRRIDRQINRLQRQHDHDHHHNHDDSHHHSHGHNTQAHDHDHATDTGRRGRGRHRGTDPTLVTTDDHVVNDNAGRRGRTGGRNRGRNRR